MCAFAHMAPAGGAVSEGCEASLEERGYWGPVLRFYESPSGPSSFLLPNCGLMRAMDQLVLLPSCLPHSEGPVPSLSQGSKISCFSFKLLFVLFFFLFFFSFWITARKVTNSAEPKERSPAKPGPHEHGGRQHSCV